MYNNKSMERLLISKTIENIGEKVKLIGWVGTKRDHGKITFIDLRDATGIVQCVGVGKMGELGTEYVVEFVGTVKKRPAPQKRCSATTRPGDAAA